MLSIRTSLCLLFATTLGACDVSPSVALRVKEKVDATQVTLAQAIEAALATVPGGVVVDAELEVENRKPVYEVELLAGDLLKKVKIDPATGAVLRTETDSDAEDVAAATAAAAQAVAGATISARAAIEAAEAELAGSVAFEFEVKPEGLFEVEIVGDDTLLEIKISAATGEIVEVEASDDSHDGGDDPTEDTDDHGGDHTEDTDDHGGDEDTDDHGNDTAEDTDDHGNDTAEDTDDGA